VKNMKKINENKSYLIGLVLGMFLGGLMVSFFFVVGTSNDISELGNAICEEEYDMVFDSYEDGVLGCKKKEVVKSYDGLKVMIKKDLHKYTNE